MGGLHPDWNINHYSEIYRLTKREFPGLSIKSLTAVEVKHIASKSGLGVMETLTILRDSGLDSPQEEGQRFLSILSGIVSVWARRSLPNTWKYTALHTN